MKINPLLTDFIQGVANCSPRVAKQMEKTACRYAKPSGCCDTIVHVMNRVKNILLSLIGCSDWQRNVRAIRAEMHTLPQSDITKLQEAKKFVKTMEVSEEKKKLAIKILNNQMNSTIQLIKPLPKFLLDVSVKIQNGKFEDQSACEACINPTFEALKNDNEAIKQKAQQEFEVNGLFDVYEIIKKEIKL